MTRYSIRHSIRKLTSCSAVAAGLIALMSPLPSAAASDPFVGEVMCGGWNFAPQGFMTLEGQLLPISQYDVLFALIGTTFGGDGQTTFALPDLRSRVIVGAGQGPGLAPRTLGEQGGIESEVLTTAKMPAHSHGMAPPASLTDATAKSPAGAIASSKARTTLYAPGPGDVAMQAAQTTSVGGGASLNNRQPTLAVQCVIAVEGIFPQRN